MWLFRRTGESGFGAFSTAEDVTQGIDGSGLTAIVTVLGFHGLGSLTEVQEFVIRKVCDLGASSGIGMETTRVLALRGVHVVMAVRNAETAKKVKENIITEIPNAKVDAMELDLSSLASVRTFAASYCSLGLPLNILINNAGVMAPPFTLSQDKIELQFATNHLGHFLLTNLLLETMKNTSHEHKQEGRIVNVSSMGHYFSNKGFSLDKINDESSYSPIYAYGLSKLANILHANELSRQFKEEKVELTANSLHPGAIATSLLRHHGFLEGVMNWVGKSFLKTIPQGAATTCYVALHPQVKGVSGEYFADSNIAKPSSAAKDSELAKKLWYFSQSMVAL